MAVSTPTSLYEWQKNNLYKGVTNQPDENVNNFVSNYGNGNMDSASNMYSWMTNPGNQQMKDQNYANNAWQVWRNINYGQKYGYGQDQNFYNNAQNGGMSKNLGDAANNAAQTFRTGAQNQINNTFGTAGANEGGGHSAANPYQNQVAGAYNQNNQQTSIPIPTAQQIGDQYASMYKTVDPAQTFMSKLPWDQYVKNNPLIGQAAQQKVNPFIDRQLASAKMSQNNSLNAQGRIGTSGANQDRNNLINQYEQERSSETDQYKQAIEQNLNNYWNQLYQNYWQDQNTITDWSKVMGNFTDPNNSNFQV